jgi:integrase
VFTCASCEATIEQITDGAAQLTVVRHRLGSGWKPVCYIKAVADLLGHSSISITGHIYGHTSDATTRAAIDGLSGVLGL